MAIFGPSKVAADADDAQWAEAGGGVFSDKTNEGYPGGEFFEVRDDSGANDSLWGMLRFSNVTIANAATINSATLRLWITGVGSIDSVNSVLTIFADVGASRQAALSASHHPPSTAWTNSTASVQVASLAVASPRSITITAIIQELVNLAGWASGDELCLNLDPEANGSDTYWSLSIADFDADTDASKASLEIDYTEGGAAATSKTYRRLMLGCG